MINIGTKIINLLLVAIGIFILSNDIFQDKRFVKTKIIIESYIVFPSININNFFKKFAFIQQAVSSYFRDVNNINNLLRENNVLHEEILRLKLQSNLNNFLKLNLSGKDYHDFEFIPTEIIGQDKNYGIIFTQSDKIKRDDIIIDECRIIAKISHIGNQFTIVSLTQNKGFIIPFVIKNTNNTGLYSFKENKIIEIKKIDNLKVGDELITFEKNGRIPNGIEIGKVFAVDGVNISLESKKCEDRNFGFIISKK